MEEQALYQAILAAPHDDAPRLVYADWLDENADAFPPVLARSERARAEFIRVQCQIARRGPAGWKQPQEAPVEPALAMRQQRLLFQRGRAWRRGFPVEIASAPFDRGFLRPMRALRPREFLEQLPSPELPFRPPLPPLPSGIPQRRYVPAGSTFHACPLWDIHLFATPFAADPLADRGQYATLLAEVGHSPQMARVGWLKLTFFGTPLTAFLRTGNFANVETLVLNAGPFPDVLEAIAENESFRSLRYIDFGSDRAAWIPDYPAARRFNILWKKLQQVNARHVPFGEMRGELHSVLRDGSPPRRSRTQPTRVLEPAPRPVGYVASGSPEYTRQVAGIMIVVGMMFVIMLFRLLVSTSSPPPTYPRFDYLPEYKMPERFNPPAASGNEQSEPTFPVKPRPEEKPDFVGPPWPPPQDEKK